MHASRVIEIMEEYRNRMSRRAFLAHVGQGEKSINAWMEV